MASKSSDIRPKITLACGDCKDRNYITRKNRRNDPDRIELKKFCPKCKSHTVHKETRSGLKTCEGSPEGAALLRFGLCSR